MKKALIVFCFLFSCISSNAQDTFAVGGQDRILVSGPTTIEEYNYITKGYRIQVESGLDMKKGYELSEISNQIIGDYYFEIKSLVRSSKKEVAALMVITKSNISGRIYYFCVPHSNSELNNLFYRDLSTWDYGITKAFAFFAASNLSDFVTIEKELQNKLNLRK